ncbi:FAD/NAD(P)-binding domain-containing protein [Hypoxylon crocopeplum]|nr:FAD/NAD(P)-binding domain-containing protein [Hypoxylon crocopeplum]
MSSTPPKSDPRILKVAIIGGGPAGLATAIELGKLDFIDWRLYEKKPAISELGTGITIQRNTWRMLEFMGAAQHLGTEDFFRPNYVGGHYQQHRNGRTGQLLDDQKPRADTPPHQHPCRAHRAKLQQALLKEVDKSRICVGNKLTEISRQENGKRLRLVFEDGHIDEVDILVGADGIRSVVRRFAFPEHRITYTGATAYRTVVKLDEAMKINGIVRAATFWHGTDGKWIYTCPLPDNEFEITAKVKDPSGGGERVSWGQDASVDRFVRSYDEFALPLRQLLQLVTYVQRFDFFAGSRLASAIDGSGSIALVGDASHPLSGAFGAGAGFALEDAYVLGGALWWAHAEGKPYSDGLELFDRVRSPHYAALYKVLDGGALAERELASLGLSADEEIRYRIEHVWNSKNHWMYYYEADNALRGAIKGLGGWMTTTPPTESRAIKAQL